MVQTCIAHVSQPPMWPRAIDTTRAPHALTAERRVNLITKLARCEARHQGLSRGCMAGVVANLLRVPSEALTGRVARNAGD